MSIPNPSRRRTFDFSKGSPDAGLAEWTSRIKAIQQEVDRDEEAEQRKLQDEITHSRMERARRRKTATGSIDWAKKAIPPSNETSEDMELITDKQQHRPDAPQNLRSSTDTSHSPSSVAVYSSSSMAPHGTRPEGVSLAAFIGGRETGPRLNKPSPQQDPSDSNLFDQTRHEGPHPIFGKVNNAVATGARFSPRSAANDKLVKTDRHDDKADLSPGEPSSSGAPSQASNSRTPPKVAPKPIIHHKWSNKSPRSPDATPELRSMPPEVPEKPLIYRKALKHTIHTSEMTPEHSPSNQPLLPSKPLVQSSPSYDVSQDTILSSSETSVSQLSTTPVQSRTHPPGQIISGQASGPPLNKQALREDIREEDKSSRHGEKEGDASLGVGGAESPSSAKRQRPTFNSPKSPPNGSSSQWSPSSNENSRPSPSPKRLLPGSKIFTPSLARPVQPQVTVQASTINSASTAISPAFLRTPLSTQDLHPSLSRLQGRGFVEKQIKASADIYVGLNSQQRERITSAGRRATVLDRWQSKVEPSTSSPSTSPLPMKPTNKGKLPEAKTVNPPRATEEATQPIKSVVSPSTTSPKWDSHTQWIRPGMERGKDQGTIVENSPSENLAHKPSLTTLVHPTRDRARKPRKAQKVSLSDLPVTSSRSPTLETLEAKFTAEIENAHESEPVGDNSRPVPVNGTQSEPLNRVPSAKIVDQPQTSVKSYVSKPTDEPSYQAPIKSTVIVASSDWQPSDELRSALTSGSPGLPEIAGPTSIPLDASCPITAPSAVVGPEEAPLSPSRHSRIPSSGQRATVMDVAQALQEHEQHIRETSLTPEPDDVQTSENVQPSGMDAKPEELPRNDVQAAIAAWGRNISTTVHQPERRRSMYDRYSIITLPPLAEETTPIPTPQGSISRVFSQDGKSTPNLHDIHQSFQDTAFTKDTNRECIAEGAATPVEHIAQDADIAAAPPTVVNSDAEPEIHLVHDDRPPPGFNLQSVLKETPYSPDPGAQTISVEVLLISGHIATSVTREQNVFYDSEVVTVVHRTKEKANGLAFTKVWAWRGKDAEFGEREERKVAELAGRFGTKGTHCVQGSEPHELIHILGGVLAIRQGRRAHWTAENTAMHRIHRVGDSIFVDQIDLAIHHLCSAYSYCLSILDSLYIWHGRGSSEDERKVASAYAHSLATEAMNITEFEEGAEDEMFWMMLGDDAFANADHWKFKSQLDTSGARLYTIDCTGNKAPVQLTSVFSGNDLSSERVFVVDCRLEIFVVVTPTARGKRMDIQLALFLAENISAVAANKRPFDPPVHVVILPSRLPLELQAAIRLCDETGLNGGSVPNHMNLLQLSEALDHMKRRSWPISTLSDKDFLPLGIDPCML